jgi:hypothetical protein
MSDTNKLHFCDNLRILGGARASTCYLLSAIALSLSLLAVTGCSSSQKLRDAIMLPCNDSAYQAIRVKQVEQMTEREFQYYLAKDSECDRAQRDVIVIDETSKASRTAVIASILVGIVTTIITITR